MRLILTMLALLAGFGVAPAQARIAAAETAGVERVEGTGSIAAVAYAVAEVQTRSASERPDKAPPKTKSAVTTIVLIGSIQFGDRARE